MDEPEPNSNIFFAWGSSVVGAAALEAPNGLLAPNAGEAAPNTGAAVELEALPKAGAAVAD